MGHSFEVHAYSDMGTALVTFEREGNLWLIAESSEYRPMEANHPPSPFDPSPESVPFMTVGEQLIVNLTARRAVERWIEVKEGQIQGLVFALDAIQNGGTLSSEDYEKYIVEQIIPEDFEESSVVMSFFATEKLKRETAAGRLTLQL